MTEAERICEAYICMASRAKYRPAAPSDSLGEVFLSENQLADRQLLLNEARKYAISFIAEENTHSFFIGVSHFPTNKAFAYAIEACRMLACADTARAIILLKMASMEAVMNVNS